MSKEEIWKWLSEQDYQTDRSETGEYVMYFELDMPKILHDYYLYRSQIEVKTDTVNINTNFGNIQM